MKSRARLMTIPAIVTLLVASAYAGQNENAAISFDFDKSPGNQGVSMIDAPGSGAFVKVEVRVENCSQLDSYSFELLYNTADLIYTTFATQNLPLEKNILNQKGAFLFDSPIVTVDDSGPVGKVTISVVNTTNDPLQCPSGDGLLGLVEFYTQTAAPKSVLFGVVKWKDPTVEDLCKNEHKGEFFMGGGSLPVELSAFTARIVGDSILLQWRTESEKETRGFNVLRSEARDGQYERVNAALIAAAGYSSSPIDYEYSDGRVLAGVTYYYKLEQIDLNGDVSYYGPVQLTLTSVDEQAPASFVLHDNFPNPFNPSTTIRFELPRQELVTLEIYNIAGVHVCTLIQAPFDAGIHAVQWDGTNDHGDKVSTGAYLYQFTAGAFVKNSRMMLLH